MGSIITALALGLLLANCARLALLVRNEAQAYKSTRGRIAYIPRDSSLRGIDVAGNVKTPTVETGGHLFGKGHLVMFLIGRTHIDKDIEYWNSVIEEAGRQALPPGPTQYWGICDSGLACDSYQPMAHFRILGYLDPYEMHVVSKTEDTREALLYDRSMRLKAEIPIEKEPSAEAALILHNIR